MNQQIQAGVNTSNELVDTVKRLALAYLSMQSVQKVLDVSDESTMTTARLDQMNQAWCKHLLWFHLFKEDGQRKNHHSHCI